MIPYCLRLRARELVAKVEADGQVMQHIRKDMLDEGEKDRSRKYSKRE